MNAKTAFRLLLLAQALTVSAIAQQTLHVEPSQSDVQFTLADPLHAVHGTFQVSSGEVVFDDHASTMSGMIIVDARSGSSGNSSRDRKMTKDQLKASSFSTVTFAPKTYTGTLKASGDSDITVTGVFTLIGQPHDLSVPMHIHQDGDVLKATGSFVVPYVQWGVKDPSNFLLKVGKEVTIQLTLVGTVAATGQ